MTTSIRRRTGENGSKVNVAAVNYFAASNITNVNSIATRFTRCSPRPNTPAADWTNQVDDDVKNERLQR